LSILLVLYIMMTTRDIRVSEIENYNKKISKEKCLTHVQYGCHLFEYVFQFLLKHIPHLYFIVHDHDRDHHRHGHHHVHHVVYKEPNDYYHNYYHHQKNHHNCHYLRHLKKEEDRKYKDT